MRKQQLWHCLGMSPVLSFWSLGAGVHWWPLALAGQSCQIFRNVGSLRWARMGLFIPQKLTNTTDRFCCFSGEPCCWTFTSIPWPRQNPVCNWMYFIQTLSYGRITETEKPLWFFFSSFQACITLALAFIKLCHCSITMSVLHRKQTELFVQRTFFIKLIRPSEELSLRQWRKRKVCCVVTFCLVE